MVLIVISMILGRLSISVVISDKAMSRGRGRGAASRVFVNAARSQLSCVGAGARAATPASLPVLFIRGDGNKSMHLSKSIRLFRLL